MSISLSDIKFKKSVVINDSGSNGGIPGTLNVVSGVRHNLFPRVSKGDRISGVTRFRKEFFANLNAANETAYATQFYMETPSTALDRFYLSTGGMDYFNDTQGDIDGTYFFTGCGYLSSDVSIGDATVSINMESNDYEFIPGGLLHISDKFMTSQTIDAGVVIGDSVTYNTTLSKWIKISQTDDTIYPNGILVDTGKVMTIQGATNEEWVPIKRTVQIATIGTGDGTTSPVVPTVSFPNGIFLNDSNPCTITVQTAGGPLSETFNPQGTTDEDNSSGGQLNFSDGTWASQIVWDSAVTSGSNITLEYTEKSHSYTGNIATVTLENAAGNAYVGANSAAGGCIDGGDVSAHTDPSMGVNTSTPNLTYDYTTYPITGDNQGTVQGTIVITMIDATNFSCSSPDITDAFPNGTIGSDYSPINPLTGTPYFTLKSAGWGGTGTAGDTLNFAMVPARFPLWLKEVVPPNTPAESHNVFLLGFYVE